jgi:pimeloyl-ACP methyl ester carboxylesterase
VATDVSELRLHVRIDEGDGPVLVMLHGINSHADDLRAVIDALGPGHRIIAPDLLGFGESPKPLDIEYSLDEHAQVLDATLTDLGVPDGFVLFGYSLGGVIAVRYAATYPQRLRRLFLLSAPFYLPPESYSRHGFGLEYAQAMLFTWLWKVLGRQKERNTPVYQLAAGQLRAVAEDYLRAGDISQHWDVMASTLENTISKSTFVDDLPRLTMPTVFALGIRDPIVRPDQTPALKRIKPDLEIRRIMGLTANHVLISSTPERVAAELLRDEVVDLNVGLRAGHGEPLLLLPDLQQDWRSCAEVAHGLQDSHDVAVLDLLGFGASPAPLSCRYTLDDHVAAVLATARRVFGERSVTMAGVGFGATVALACAATEPGAVERVVGVAPVLPRPGLESALPGRPELLASRDVLVASARDEGMQRIADERLEREVLPAARSMTALLATDTSAVVARVRSHARLVLPGARTGAPAWLARLAADNPELTVETTPAVDHPERSAALVEAAIRGERLPALTTNPAAGARRDPMSRLLSGLNTRLMWRGLFQLALGLPLLLYPGVIPMRLVTAVLAAWLGVEGTRTVIGAFGLRRRGRPWLGWFVIGLLGLVFATAVLAGGVVALNLVAWIIIVGAAVRGVGVLLTAWQAPRTPGRRWVLVLDGLLSLAISIGILVYSPLGSRLLRWVVGGYLTGSGVSSLLVAWRNHRAARAGVRDYRARGIADSSPAVGPGS